MKAKKDGRAAPVRVAVKEIGPLVVTTQDAGIAIGRSVTWLRQMRALDGKRIDQGLPPVGPTWRTMGNSIVYAVADLQEWLDRATHPHGRAPFRGDIGKEVQP